MCANLLPGWLIKPILTSWNVLWLIASLRLIVVDFTIVASIHAWLVSVKADIELLTVCLMGIVRMSNDLTRPVIWLVIGTHESILQCDFLGNTIWTAVSLVLPNACARVLIKVKSRSALVFNVFAVLAHVESVAIGLVGMRENAIFTRAIIVCTTCWLC